MTHTDTYHDMLRHILIHGKPHGDRTGTGTIRVFGYQNRYDLQKGFPLLTTKKVFTKGIIHELLWFLKGDTNIEYLVDNGVHIWDEWAGDDGELGPVYGAQWRHWMGDDDISGVDQIANIVDTIKNNPDSRRIILTAWNPSEVDDMALPPCHCLVQFRVQDERLDCQLYQRSADSFLGVPFNIASYAMLTHMLAHVCGLQVGEFVHTFGDLHIYNNHREQVATQLARTPTTDPAFRFARKVDSIDDFKYEDFIIEGYCPHPAIKAEVSV